MAIGQKMGSLKALKQSMAKGGGGAFIKYIPKNGSMNVRFIQEPEEWVNYVEHFDQMLRKSYPCNGEQSCPGCAGGERKSSRYLANAVDRDDNDRVIPLQMPKDLANRLVVRYERNGTLTDRDFELSRSGEGLDTVYDLDAGVVDRAKIDKYTPLDLLKVLEDAYNNVFGGGADEDDEPETKPASAVKARTKSTAGAKVGKKAAKKAEPEPEEDEEEDEDPEDTTPEPEFTPEADDDDDEADDDSEEDTEESEDDDDEGYTEEYLRSLPLGSLRAIARDEFGVSTKGKNQDALIEAIFESSDDGDDNAPPY